MVMPKLTTVIAFGLGLAHVTRGQVSTASLFPVGFQDDNLEGQVLGSGPDGTSFALSGTFGTLDIPFTMTLVEDATHVSESAVIVTASASFFVNVECGMSNVAVCTEVVSEGTSVTTILETGAVQLIPVPVSGSGITGGSTSTSTSTSTSGISSPSVLPPSISVTTPSATPTQPSVSTPSSTPLNPSTSSGTSSKTIIGGAMLMLPVFVVLSML